MRGKSAVAAGCCVVVVACTSTPPMAPDYSLPIQAIVLHCVCELRDAFREFANADPKKLPDGFPAGWSASIVLTPKVDTDFNVRSGLTGSSKGPNSNTFFNTWMIGSAPGAGIDFKANKNGALTFYVHGSDLLNSDKKINCSDQNATYHAFTQDLGIKDWLERLMNATFHDDLAGTVSTDKPTFGAEITIKTDGTGSFTYNFPFGTNFASMGGWYQLDEQISIALTKDAPKTKYVEFPPVPGKNLKNAFTTLRGVRGPRGVSESGKSKLDAIQLEQTLRNLQLRQ